jgi:hypothetical protein
MSDVNWYDSNLWSNSRVQSFANFKPPKSPEKSPGKGYKGKGKQGDDSD